MGEKKHDFWKLTDRLISIANEGKSKFEFFKKMTDAIFSHFEADQVCFCLLEDKQLQIKRINTGLSQQSAHRCILSDNESNDRTCCFKSLFTGPVVQKIGDMTSRESPPFITFHNGRPPETNLDFWKSKDNLVRLTQIANERCLENGPGEVILLPIVYGKVKRQAVLLQLVSKETNIFQKESMDNVSDIARLLGVVMVSWQNSWELNERIKELSCLYQITQRIDISRSSLPNIFLDVIGYIPSAWLYADSARCRIVFDGKQYSLPGYPEGNQTLRADIIIQDVSRGFVEVCYTKEKPKLDIGPFLTEELNLLKIIVRELSIIAESKIHQEKMDGLKEQLKHANRLTMTGQVAAAVAHELNEPLTNIIGFAQLAAKNNEASPELKKDLVKIESLSLHTREIVRRLLMFSKKMPSNFQAVDLNQVVEDALAFLRHHCLKRGIALNFKPYDQPLEMEGDANQLKQVIFNLVMNAVHATASGGSIVVETGLNGIAPYLVVVDDGHGMSSDVLEKIFIPFFSTRHFGEGTGLGLSVVAEIVEAHCGAIRVDSEPDRGTRVTIVFDHENFRPKKPEIGC